MSPLVQSPSLTAGTVCSYFGRIHALCDVLDPVLDPVLHTPASTFACCPSLFTDGECSAAWVDTGNAR